MKANELRIGNLIHSIDEDFNNELIIVDANDICNVDCEDDNDGYEPIPLTAEWLGKFGFSKGFKGCSYLNLPGDGGELLPFFYVNSRNSVEYVQLMDSMEENEIIRIKYVHQLQNLYFALTGEELTMKEETK